jgi:hypothetical protein
MLVSVHAGERIILMLYFSRISQALVELEASL